MTVVYVCVTACDSGIYSGLGLILTVLVAKGFLSNLTAVVLFITPPLVGGRGIVFGRFLSSFVFLSATLRENGCTDLHEMFREGLE